MANKAHVAKTYHIEYGDPHLNHAQEAINRLLFDTCGGFSWFGEYVECAEHIEVSREDLRDLIARIEDTPAIAERVLSMFYINDMYSANDVVKCFKQWIAESDPDNSFIVVDWF